MTPSHWYGSSGSTANVLSRWSQHQERAFNTGSGSPDVFSRDVQPALVIGREYTTERDSVPVQYNGVM